ncbi:DUF6297 family protein [Nonomuraea typhae]|uniref:DUF6297 family protein n=1 Tax=Nonomuraea typhae TaxID=2603600 RepID=A0ABW7YRU1_9ACTN
MSTRDIRGIRALTRARGRMSLSDRYSAVFGLAMLGALLAQPVLDAFAAAQGPVRPDRAGAGLALVALVYAAFLWAARTLGPVVLSAADAAWLLLSPLDRRASWAAAPARCCWSAWWRARASAWPPWR